jgi:hypothetical protein
MYIVVLSDPVIVYTPQTVIFVLCHPPPLTTCLQKKCVNSADAYAPPGPRTHWSSTLFIQIKVHIPNPPGTISRHLPNECVFTGGCVRSIYGPRTNSSVLLNLYSERAKHLLI